MGTNSNLDNWMLVIWLYSGPYPPLLVNVVCERSLEIKCSYWVMSFLSKVYTYLLVAFQFPYFSINYYYNASSLVGTLEWPRLCFFDKIDNSGKNWVKKTLISFPSISYYFHIPKNFLNFFPHTGKNRNRRKSNLLP